MLKFFVRTTKERQLDSSYSQIGYELLIDTEHKPTDSFIEQLEIISDYDAVLLEDDLILCDNFKEEIEKVINKYPHKIINFFTYPTHYFVTKETNIFCYNQCTYYPKGISSVVAQEMKKLRNKYNAYDTLENRALKELNMTHIAYRPCLVQHIDVNSFIQKQHHGGLRRSIYFIDYLKELGITYKDAVKNENQIKLKNLMKQKFKDLDNI